MADVIKKFASPSKIIFTLAKDGKKSVFTLADAERGDTFMFKDAICMLSEVSAYQALEGVGNNYITQTAKIRIKELLDQTIFVTNLQTGRTFAAISSEEIQWIKVTMTVESV